MALLITSADLKTHIYEDIAQEISRDDQDVIDEAIATAIADAKGYLSRYDLSALFGTPTTDPTVVDANLKSKVKDLAKWNLIRLANPNIDYQATKDAYQHAIEYYFEKVQKGLINPEGWPYRDTSVDPIPPQGNEVTWSSNRKRNNHF